MKIEGEVPLEVVVWLGAAAEAQGAKALSAALPMAEWMMGLPGRFRVRFRAGRMDVEMPYDRRWTGLVTGRVVMAAPPSGTSEAPFKPYVLEFAAAAPLRLESCWFAVDRDGRVACFDRQLLGAAPMKRCWGPRPEPEQRPWETPALLRSLEGRHAVRPGESPRAYSFVADADALASALAAGAPAGSARRWQVRAEEGRVVASAGHSTSSAEHVTAELVDWLHARGLCQGCARSALSDARLAGLYVYESPGRNRAAPYERMEEPLRPWTAEEAASELGLQRAALAGSTLPVSFDAKERVQPIEYVRCTWSDTVPWESEAGERHGRDVTSTPR